jgi:hypothetical protein
MRASLSAIQWQAVKGGVPPRHHAMTDARPVLEYGKPEPRTRTPLASVAFVLSAFVLLTFIAVSLPVLSNRSVPERFWYCYTVSPYISLAALPCAVTGLFFRDSRFVGIVALALLMLAWGLLFVTAALR